MIKVNYFLRRPVYPIICNINNNLIAAKNKNDFERRIAKYELEKNNYDIIDRTGEGWCLHTNHLLISPLSFKKSWEKKEIINLYNNRINTYSEKFLSNKRYYKIFDDLYELIIQAEKTKRKNKKNE